MILRPAADGCLLITQPDHARLARRIMEHCVALAVHPRRNAILHAIGEHDNGWTEVDAAPAVDPATGTVIDFIHAPISVRQGVWPRAIARLASDPWAAALVAHHAAFAYDRFRGDPAWTAFFTGMETSRTAMMRWSDLTLETLEADYAFVRLGDLISLAFCTGSTTAQRFGDWTVLLSGTRVVVTPDLFGGGAVPFEITALDVRARSFRSDEELRDAMSAASSVMLRGQVSAAMPGAS